MPTSNYHIEKRVEDPAHLIEYSSFNRKDIKQVDKFTNKSHGGALLCLFRWSKARDFQ